MSQGPPLKGKNRHHNIHLYLYKYVPSYEKNVDPDGPMYHQCQKTKDCPKGEVLSPLMWSQAIEELSTKLANLRQFLIG